MAKKLAKKPAKKAVKKVIAKKTAKKAAPKKVAVSKKPAAKKSPTKATIPAKTNTETAKSYLNLVTPLDDRLLVYPQAQEQMTAGGLYIPGTVETGSHIQGQVVAIGRGHMDQKSGRVRKMDVQVGDKVLFEKFSGSEVTFDQKKMYFLRESDLLGIID